MSEKPLEQQLEEWVSSLLPDEPLMYWNHEIHRVLQLARRDGVRAYHRSLALNAPDEASLLRLFPVTRTVTEPNELPDPHGSGEWCMRPCRGRCLRWVLRAAPPGQRYRVVTSNPKFFAAHTGTHPSLGPPA